VILGLGASERVKLYKTRYLVEMTVTLHPDLLEACFRPLGNTEKVHCGEHEYPCDVDEAFLRCRGQGCRGADSSKRACHKIPGSHNVNWLFCCDTVLSHELANYRPPEVISEEFARPVGCLVGL
jgi:hypothetical protein